jgi:PAS domain S-box-containing protein
MELKPLSMRSASSPRRPLPCLLLVDDQPLNIQTLYRIFADDYQVLMATSGPRALALCEESPPDLILLDLVMPGMDGWEVLSRLQASPATAGIPVIIVTAKDDDDVEARGLQAGAVDFITKPIHPQAVQARVRTHVELGRSKALLSATLESTADDIVVLDPEGRLMSCNQRFATHWQLPPQDAQGDANFSVLQHMQSQMSNPDELLSVLGGQLERQEERIATVELTSGRIVQRHIQGLTMQGRVVGHVFSFRDVTERVQAERALADLNASLESKVRYRTEALAKASKLADAASRAKSDFLSNMSHEMRTPMNSILGMSYLALREGPSPKVRDYLERISESGQHLLGLISNILDFAKIESGKLTLEVTDFSVPNVLLEVDKQLIDQAQAKGLRLVTDCGPGLAAPLRGDPLRLRQILLNFVANAIKFSQTGEIVLRARMAQNDIAGAEVIFEVEDHGIGISPEKASELFQAFHQVDTSATRRFGGTGLGLAICKRLADIMGGQVGVRSVPGHGSIFYFMAPFLWGEASEVAASEVASDTRWEVEASSVLKGRCILVADDNPLNQRVAQELLVAMGCEVLIANDGVEVLEQVAQHPEVDAILMDVQMPRMDGLEASQRLREHAGGERLIIVAMTANARPEDERACLEAGMNDFVTKPVVPRRFYATVAHWLGMDPPPVWQAPAQAPSEAQPVAKGLSPAPASSVPQDAPASTSSKVPTVSEAHEDAVDLEVLASLTRRNPKMMREIAGVFLSFMDKTCHELDEALSGGNRAALMALGHKCKSSAAAVGAMGLSRTCQELEVAMQNDTVPLERAAALVAEVKRLMVLIRERFALVS